MIDSLVLKNNNKSIIAGIYFISSIFCILVYICGGSHTIYPSLMFITITLSSILLSRKNSFVHAVFFGFLLGPFMPLNTTFGESQSILNWGTRLFLFVFVAEVVSFLTKKIREEDRDCIIQTKRVNEAQMTTILALVKIIELRDDTTGKHVERIAELTKCLLTKILESNHFTEEISFSDIECISRASSLHDIGKNAIPDIILLKADKLSKSEFELMKTHTTIGASMIRDVLDSSKDKNVFFGSSL